MPCRSAFSFEMLDIHLQPSMRCAHDVRIAPGRFDLSLRERLEALRRLFDQEAALRAAPSA